MAETEKDYHYIYEAVLPNGRSRRNHDIGLVKFFIASHGRKGYVRRKRCYCDTVFYRAA